MARVFRATIEPGRWGYAVQVEIPLAFGVPPSLERSRWFREEVLRVAGLHVIETLRSRTDGELSPSNQYQLIQACADSEDVITKALGDRHSMQITDGHVTLRVLGNTEKPAVEVRGSDDEKDAREAFSSHLERAVTTAGNTARENISGGKTTND